MVEYNKTYEKDALKSITKGINLPGSAPKGILTNQQMTKIKNNDNNIMMDSSNKPKNLATNSNQAKDERPSSQVDRPSSSSVTVGWPVGINENEFPTFAKKRQRGYLCGTTKNL